MTIQTLGDITSFKWATVTALSPLAIKLDGDTVALALIPDSIVDPQQLFVGSRVRVELSLRKVVIHGVASAGMRGTTAERNARFGVPATDGQKATLANRLVRWFNTDLGWEESYYATTGLAGLTARGLISPHATGWYPVGPGGPKVYLVASAQQTLATNAFFTNWTPPGTGASFRTGGSSFIDVTSGIIKPKIAGRYKYDIDVSIQNGAGSVVLYFARHNAAGAQADIPFADYCVLNASYGSHIWGPIPDIVMAVDESIRVMAAVGGFVHAQGANNLNQSTAHYEMIYLGPPLVSN